jgi:hypothetical protein
MLDSDFHGTNWSRTRGGKLETDILLGVMLSQVNIKHKLVYLPF